MILVTGGLGFIGAHTVVALLDKNHKVLIVDDLSNSFISVLDGIVSASGKSPIFEQFDLKNKQKTEQLFRDYTIDGIIHFAAYKAVGESTEKPLDYYENNITPLINLLLCAKEQPGHIPFIFSSSCTVYGEANTLPISENEPIKMAMSPYGNTKQIGEEIVRDATTIYANIPSISLRYFNPIGAHSSAKIGELPLGVPQNLVPFITQTAAGIRESLTVFGNDYPTHDGTCIRDYIHVEDLAQAHISALEFIQQSNQPHFYDVFNLGTGKGQSVLDIIHAFERVSGQSLPYVIGKRRKGDVIAAYAETTKAEKMLDWKATRTIDEALYSAWKWEQQLKR